ncbi:cytochrome P450 [Colletotrichum zoysiae]|uniref:Cytochrome P450 n=1 Tax=Colletotrichum zoysiae TaxID=1216348 RepID=A0AAD9H499_9PEZI|nr:cytochrome P450 [Colletotrichum zoysiae]
MDSITLTAALIFTLHLLSYFFHSVLCLVRNIRIAKQTGIPVVWSPVSSFNPLWIIICKRAVPFFQRLPFGFGNWTKYSTLDWTWVDRTTGGSESTVHKRYGDTFVNVTPRDVEIHTCDHHVSDQILRKYTNDFPKISHYAKVLDVLGTSLVSSDGDAWTRHRKATVATLSDKTNALVWAEAIRQTRQMVQHYEEVSKGCILDPIEDVRELYLHVFTRVCYGVAYNFKQPEQIPTGHWLGYKTCLYTSIKGILMLRLIPWSIMRLPYIPLPSRVRTFRQAIMEMQQYLDEMITNCRSSISGDTKRDSQNLLSFMVRRGKESQYNPKTDIWLSDSEIRGNLFTYALGGHESSAHTLSFALYLLAAHPETQDWLIQEINQVIASNANWMSDEAFIGLYSRLPRCQAVILETLRLYPSVTVIPKYTNTATTLSINGSNRYIPPNTNVFVNMPSIQIRESIWGSDAGLWNPGRWVVGPAVDDAQNRERVQSPPDGAFLAWAEGKRACPGRRFSQVGLVAALVGIFTSHRIEVMPNEGEAPSEARMRAHAAVNNTYAVMTVHMYNPYSVKIRMVKKENGFDYGGGV